MTKIRWKFIHMTTLFFNQDIFSGLDNDLWMDFRQISSTAGYVSTSYLALRFIFFFFSV